MPRICLVFTSSFLADVGWPLVPVGHSESPSCDISNDAISASLTVAAPRTVTQRMWEYPVSTTSPALPPKDVML